MNIEVTGRQMEITPDVRARIENGVQPLIEIAPLKTSSVQFVLAREKNRFQVSAVIRCKYHVFSSEVEDFDLVKAMDGAIAKLAAQMTSIKEKIVDHRAEPVCASELRKAEEQNS